MHSPIVARIAYSRKPICVRLYKFTWIGADILDAALAVRIRILRLCEERYLTINKLATLSALPPSSVKNILYGKSKDPKLTTIKKICDGLDITLGEFFTTDVFDTLDQEIK